MRIGEFFMDISILGCGRWGSFLGWYLDSLGHKIIQWGLENSYEYQILKSTKKNEYVNLSPGINLTADLEFAVSKSNIIIISISSQSLDSFIKTVIKYNLENKKFVLCMKGIENGTGRRLSEILVDNGISPETIAVWVGPGHIQDFTKGIPNCMVIDGVNKDLVKFLADSFKSDLIKFYYGSDLIGSEIGAAAKNVMGIAAGMLDGVFYSTLKGPLMSRGTREVARLIKSLGGNELSAYGLCHLGDYETTLFSEHSHNRRFGEMFIKCQKFDKLAEGVKTSGALITLAKKAGVEMPITLAINKIVNYEIEPRTALLELFSRNSKFEF